MEKRILIVTNERTYEWLKQRKHNYSWKTLLIIGAKIIDETLKKLREEHISELKLADATDKIIKEIIQEKGIIGVEAVRKGKPPRRNLRRQNSEEVLIKW